jgi:hypothetical protein
VWYAYFTKAAEVAQVKLDEVNALVNGLEGFATKFDAVSKETKGLESAAAPLLLASAERTAWSAILEELGKNLPPRYIWITGLSPVSAGKVVAVGGKPAAPVPAPSSAPAKPGQSTTPAGPPMIDALEITGLYLSNPPNTNEARIIDQFVERLQKSPLFKIESAAKTVTQRTPPDGQSWAYGYTIMLPLSQPIPLQ